MRRVKCLDHTSEIALFLKSWASNRIFLIQVFGLVFFWYRSSETEITFALDRQIILFVQTTALCIVFER